MPDDRDRPDELLKIVDVCKGFGTVVITFAGSRFACSIGDLREAIERRTAEQLGQERDEAATRIRSAWEKLERGQP